MLNEHKWCVYRHRCSNGRMYFGITSQEPEKRWNGGWGYVNSNWRFFRYILAVGWDNIEHEVLAEGLTEAEAREMEKSLIQENAKVSYNQMFVPKSVREGQDLQDAGEEFWAKLSDEEREAVDLVCLTCGMERTLKNRFFVHKNHLHCRTQYELESGDPVRRGREIRYLRQHRTEFVKMVSA